MPLTTTGRNTLLGSRTAFTHKGLFTDVGTTEVTGGSYARQAQTYGAPSGGVSATTGALTIPVPAGATVVTVGDFDALTAGNSLGYAGYNSTAVPKGVGSVDAIATDLIQSNGHGLTTDDRVFVFPVAGETLPTGLSAAVLYWVIATGLTTDAFKLSTSQGGAAVDITALGELGFQKTVPNTFASAGSVSIAIGASTLDLTFG